MTDPMTPSDPTRHRRCTETTGCSCWTAGAMAEAESRRLRPQTREVVDYIRAISENDPALDSAAIAQRVANVFIPDPTGQNSYGPMTTRLTPDDLWRAMKVADPESDPTREPDPFAQCDDPTHVSVRYERERGWRVRRTDCLDCAALAALPTTPTPSLDAALGRLADEDIEYHTDPAGITALEPNEPDLWVRYEAIRAALTYTEPEH